MFDVKPDDWVKTRGHAEAGEKTIGTLSDMDNKYVMMMSPQLQFTTQPSHRTIKNDDVWILDIAMSSQQLSI